jgi:hypothetical protein
VETKIHFWSYLAQISLEWEMFQTIVAEKIKTHTLWSTAFFLNHAIYEIMWKHTVEAGRSQRIIQSMWIACLIPKAVSTHSEYVILTDFSLQQWLYECTSNLHYTDMACLVIPYHWLTHLLPYLPLFPTQMHNPSDAATDTRTRLY